MTINTCAGSRGGIDKEGEADEKGKEHEYLIVKTNILINTYYFNTHYPKRLA